MVSVKLLRIDESKVEGRTYETVKGALDDVIGRLKAAVHTVFAQAGYLNKPADGIAVQMKPPAPEGAGGGWHVPGTSWGLWAGGALLVVVGGFMGLQANQSFKHATDANYPGAQKDAASGAQSQLFANLGFGVGGAALAAGTVMLFVDHGGAAPADGDTFMTSVTPVAGPGGFGAVATVRF